MASFPEPKAGLVISYAYLWAEESEGGQVEGRKDRPCAIILAIDDPEPEGDKRRHVAVVPITHSLPRDLNVAVEIPWRVKEDLGLDSERSWVVLDEINEFLWPGFDLRPIERNDGRVDYGFLPPKFFDRLVEKFAALLSDRNVARISRDE